jgi:biopolymer transport protein ExbD
MPAAKASARPEPAEDEAGESAQKWKTEEAELDMTPMVDVTFQLLIFFMVTAAFAMQKSIEVPKPKQDAPSTQVVVAQDPEQDPSFVTVYVDQNNTYRVVTVDWDTEAPSEQELLRKMREARHGDTAGHVPTKLLVKAHGDSLHEKVVAALDAGTEVGMEEIQLMTVEEIE